MRVAAARRPLLHVAAVTAGLTSTCAYAAQWSWTPDAETFARSQRNPRLSANDEEQKDDSHSIGARISAEVRRQTERVSLSIHPGVVAHRHLEDKDLDRDELQLDTSLVLKGERLSWRGDASARRDSTLTSELGSTGLNESNLRHDSYNVSVGPVWQASELLTVRSSLDTMEHRYPGVTGASLVDYRYSTATTGIDYVFSERVVLAAETVVGRLSDEGSGPHSDNASVTLQARYAWSPFWTVGVGGGPSWLKVGDDRQRGFLYSAHISRAFEKASLSLGATRRQAPSGTGNVTDLEEADLAFSMQLSERLVASLAAGVTRRKNALRAINLDLSEVRYNRAELNLTWRATPHWRISALVGGATQRVDALFFKDATARGYEARLTLNWTGDRHGG